MRLSDRARGLRRTATKEERIVWRWLRDRRLRSVKYRRQHPILNYIADFYCAELKLTVEIDGSGHETVAQQHYDVRRACDLSKLGVTIIRVRNEDMRRDPTAAADTLIAQSSDYRANCNPHPAFGHPLPQAGEGADDSSHRAN